MGTTTHSAFCFPDTTMSSASTMRFTSHSILYTGFLLQALECHFIVYLEDIEHKTDMSEIKDVIVY